jgi:hypothetical protein
MKKLLVILALSLLWSSASYSWGKPSLDEVEKDCEVWMWSDNYGDIDCKSGLEEVERNCEAYMAGGKSGYGDIECKGDYKYIEKSCEIWIWGWPWGDVECR